MSAKAIRRGNQGRQPAPRVAARRPAARRRSWLGETLAAVPVPYRLLRRLRTWLLAAGLAGGLAAGVWAMGLPQMAALDMAHALGAAGFEVRNVEVTGRTHVDRDAVYRIAMQARAQAMPLVDLADVRRQLLTLGWIKDARVSRRLPDTLVVDIVERRPAAVWQYRQRLALIDETGAVIAPVDPLVMPTDLPLVIGPAANAHAAALAALVATQPALKPLVEGASWVGGRRWDLRFQSGEVLALPEGEAQARAALAYFARRDGERRLLGQGYVRFDMRDPTRMVIRMSREPGMKVAEPDTSKSI